MIRRHAHKLWRIRQYLNESRCPLCRRQFVVTVYAYPPSGAIEFFQTSHVCKECEVDWGTSYGQTTLRHSGWAIQFSWQSPQREQREAWGTFYRILLSAARSHTYTRRCAHFAPDDTQEAPQRGDAAHAPDSL